MLNTCSMLNFNACILSPQCSNQVLNFDFEDLDSSWYFILIPTANTYFRRLKKMQPQQPGYNSSRVYLELLADLPWQKASEEHELDLRAAKERLDSDHYGLVKVKQRIIEYLAVRKVDQLSISRGVECP